MVSDKISKCIEFHVVMVEFLKIYNIFVLAVTLLNLNNCYD